MIACAAFGATSLGCFDSGRRPNLGGPVGDAMAAYLSAAIGYQSYLVMALVVWLAIRVWTGTPLRTMAREVLGGAILIAALATGASLWDLSDAHLGGQAGAMAAGALNGSLNLAGGYLAVLLALALGFALMVKRAPTEVVSGLAGRIRPRRDTRDDRDSDRDGGVFTLGGAESRDSSIDGERFRDIETDIDGKPRALKVRRIEPLAPAARDKRDKAPTPRSKGGYKLPAPSLLDNPPAEHAQVDEEQLERSARVLEQKLADFGVEGRVVEVQPGPVVTMYKFEPGSGIKVSQIVNLADDLSMALRAAAVRIQAPVPGEAVVGIEVPNRKRERVYLREILEAEEFAASRSQLDDRARQGHRGHARWSPISRGCRIC